MNASQDAGAPMDRRVIVVDDEPVIRLMLNTYLSQQGWTCLLAGDPPEALKILGQEPVSHAIVDLHLGEYSGFDLIRAIAEQWPRVRIVAITGSVIGGPAAALAVGAAVVLGKPLSPLGQVLDALEGRSPSGEYRDDPVP